MENIKKIKEKSVSAMLSSFSGFFINTSIQLFTTIILARLLDPEDYGLLGMILIFINLSQTVIDSGLNQALIREKVVNKEEYSTVFFYNLIFSIILYIILYLSSNHISNFFNEPRLVAIIRVTGLSLIIGSLGLIQKTMLIRRIDFKTQVRIEIISSLFSGLIAIILAILKFGVWSLVIKLIFFHLITSLLFIINNKWKPSFTFNFPFFKRIFIFGWKLLVTRVLAILYWNAYNVIIGKIYSAEHLGYYTKSIQLSELAAFSIATPIQKVSYPVLSQLDNKLLSAGFIKTIRITNFISFPLMIGLIIVSRPLIYIVLGSKWLPMVPYLNILFLGSVITPHITLNYNLLLVKGRSDLYLKTDFIIILVGIIFLSIVIFFDLGIYGLLVARLISGYISFIITSFYSKKFASYNIKMQFKDMSIIIIITVLMGTGMYLFGLFVSLYPLKLVIQLIVGISLYIFFNKMLKVKEFDMVFHILQNFIRKIKKQ